MATHNPTRAFKLCVLLMALLLGAVACGGGEGGSAETPAPADTATTTDSAESSESESEAAAEPTDPLNVAVFFTNAAFAHVFLAQSEGYFEEENVDVTLQNDTGSNTLSVVVSGQADLGMIGAGAPLLAAKEGKATSIVFAHIGNGNGGVVVSAPEIENLEDMSRVAATGVGSSSYGFCNYYNESKGFGWEIVPLQDIQALRGAVASGQVDGACNSYVNLKELIDAGDVNVLIDTRDPADREEYIGPDFPEAAVFGLTENLQAKSEAIVRFMRAIGKAQADLESKSPEEIAESLHALPVFENMTVEELATQVEDTRPYYAPNAGYIAPDVWDFALSQYETWGIGVDPSDPVFSYDERVDMSFYEDAIGAPSS